MLLTFPALSPLGVVFCPYEVRRPGPLITLAVGGLTLLQVVVLINGMKTETCERL